MRKILYLSLVLLLVLGMCFALASCNGDPTPTPDPAPNPSPDPDPTPDPDPEPAPEIPKIDFSGVSFENAEITYDGKEHSIEITGALRNVYVTVEYEGNGKVDAGAYPVVAQFYYKGIYLEGRDLNATMTIKRAVLDTYGISFGNKVVYYDGNVHSLEVKGDLPDDVTVTYVGNGQSEPGTYEVTAKFESGSGNYVPVPDMTAKLQIKKAVAGMAGVSLSDSTVIFDGNTHSIHYEGTLGEGITLYGYSSSENRNAGTYDVIARFARDGVYDSSLNMRVTQTIKPARVSVHAEDKTVKFDGQYHSLDLEWDSDPISALNVVEIGNNIRTIGENKVIFKLVPAPGDEDNYVGLADVVATLTIELDPDLVTEGLVYKFYDGGFHVIGYNGTDECVMIPETHTEGSTVGRVIAVDAGAFRDCTTVKYVHVGNNVSSISSNAFRGCSALIEISFGKSLMTIGQLAFADTALKSIKLGDLVQSIGFGILRNTEVESVELPFIGGSRNTSNAYLGYIFGASGYAGNEYYVPATLKRVVVTDKCTIIPAYAMYGCSGIEEVVIGAGVKEIGISAFSGCTAMKSLYIPNTVTEIPAAANAYNSIVYNCSEELVITLGAKSVPDTYGMFWCAISDTENAEVKTAK